MREPMMNAHKAREYFSAHYEGSLDRGLRESFERVLRADAQIQAEYRAFTRTMDQLSGLTEFSPEPPSDLHDRIMARLDLNAWEQKQRTRQPVFAWWKSALLAAAVIAVAAFGVIRAGQEAPLQPNEASSVSVPMPARARLEVKPIADGVQLNYPRVNEREVIIRDADGNEKERLHLLNQGIQDKPLTNTGEQAVLVEVVIEDSHTWIALPGTGTPGPIAGEGDVRQLALDIANQCRIPVIIQGPAHELTTWTIDSSDAHRSAEEALKAHNLRVELRGDQSERRMLWILEN